MELFQPIMINQAQMDKALILNENFLNYSKQLPKIIEKELMNTDQKYFHYRISVYGLTSKMINHLKNNGFFIKSINCIQGYNYLENEKIHYAHISISLKWKIS